MSNLSPNDLPGNIRLIPEAEEDFLELDHHQQILPGQVTTIRQRMPL